MIWLQAINILTNNMNIIDLIVKLLPLLIMRTIHQQYKNAFKSTFFNILLKSFEIRMQTEIYKNTSGQNEKMDKNRKTSSATPMYYKENSIVTNNYSL